MFSITSRGARLLVAGTAIAGLTAGATTPSAAADTQASKAVVAKSVLQDTKAVLTATRTPHDTATVRLTVYRRAHGTWHSTGTQVVGKRSGWFWFVTSGPHAVCRFSVSNTPRRAVTVRLLVTPSIGCAAKTQHFHVQNGQLVSG
jgi:hypothetical protein